MKAAGGGAGVCECGVCECGVCECGECVCVGGGGGSGGGGGGDDGGGGGGAGRSDMVKTAALVELVSVMSSAAVGAMYMPVWTCWSSIPPAVP